MRALGALILAGTNLLGSIAYAQSTSQLQDELKACESAEQIAFKPVTGAPAEGTQMRFGKPFTMRVGLKRSSKPAVVSVWVNGTRQLVVGGSELQSFDNDDFGFLLPFTPVVPSPQEQPKISEGGDLRLALTQAMANEVTFMVTEMDGEKRACGSYSASYAMGAIDTYALVMGFHYLSSGRGRALKYANFDAREVTRHLIKSVGVKPANIWLLTDDPQMSGQVPEGVKVVAVESPGTYRKALGTILSQADLQSRLYVFYSGHMVLPQTLGQYYTDNVSLFLPQSDEDDPGTLLLRSEVLDGISRAKLSSTALILDACFSGRTAASYRDSSPASPRAVGAKSWRSAIVDRGSKAGQDPEFEGANISSSDGVSPSWEFDQFKHGVFTYYLLNAGKGKSSLSLADAFKEAKQEMAQLKPDGWKEKLKQEPTGRFTGAGLEIPWRVQP